jgi:hypothetical protein
MKTLMLFLLIFTCGVICAAQTRLKCFRSEWLQGERSINLTISGSKVSGTFAVGPSDDPAAKIYRFSGTRRGKVLTIAFAADKRPDVSPSEIKSLVWKLIKKGGREFLQVKVFGKNYETNKYENSFVDFEPCESEQERSL